MILFEQTTHPATKKALEYTSKLKNVHLHLQEIVSKKKRLELEEKRLRRLLLKKQKDYEVILRQNLKLESTDLEPLGIDLQALIHKDPGLELALLHFDNISRSIIEEWNGNPLGDQEVLL